jgi:hypothetical protein
VARRPAGGCRQEHGGTLMREPNRNAVMNLRYAFVKDPDGTQIELIMDGK